MTVAYADRLQQGYPVSKYLAQRFLRLGPLYVAVASLMAAIQLGHGANALALGTRYLLNVTFLMGFANPGETSLVTGGWSLGIEFVFYLAFPVMAALARARWFRAVALVLFAGQLLFVNHVLASRALEDAWAQYTQFAAFMGYFSTGIVVGVAVNKGWLRPGNGWIWIAWLLLVVVLSLLGAPTARETLVGFRGAALAVLAVLLVALSAQLRLRGFTERLATGLGDASYPLYLLHPFVFSAIRSKYGLPGLASASPALVVGLGLCVSLAVSLLVWRKFELPILTWGKRRLK